MNKKILIIEDDTHLRPIYEEKLGEAGFTVFWEETGEAALEVAKKEQPCLILLDLLLAGNMNGYDVIKKLKADPDTAKLRILILTNIGADGKTAEDVGAIGYMVKTNVSLKEIVDKVNECTES